LTAYPVLKRCIAGLIDGSGGFSVIRRASIRRCSRRTDWYRVLPRGRWVRLSLLENGGQMCGEARLPIECHVLSPSRTIQCIYPSTVRALVAPASTVLRPKDKRHPPVSSGTASARELSPTQTSQGSSRLFFGGTAGSRDPPSPAPAVTGKIHLARRRWFPRKSRKYTFDQTFGAILMP